MLSIDRELHSVAKRAAQVIRQDVSPAGVWTDALDALAATEGPGLKVNIYAAVRGAAEAYAKSHPATANRLITLLNELQFLPD